MEALFEESYRFKLNKEILISLRKDTVDSCERCSGSGFIYKKKRIICKCLKTYRKKFLLIKSNISQSKADFVTRGNIDDIKVREFIFKHEKYARKRYLYENYVLPYMENYKKVLKQGYSFVFCGENGSGKTVASISLMLEFLSHGCECYYISFPQYLSYALRSYNDRFYTDFLNEIGNLDFLVIDEIGKESNVTNKVVSDFELLIKHREALNKPTVLIMNLIFSGDESNTFKDRFGDSSFRILQEKYRVLHFDPNVNFRVKYRKQWY